MKIGNVEIKNPTILAPMAGITNLPFRTLCKKYGVGLSYTEMVSSEALTRNSEESFRIIDTDPKNKPTTIQIFGSNENRILESAKIIEDKKLCQIIDINFGCPANDIYTQGAGSALLKDIPKMKSILKLLKSEINLPITAKIRTGISNHDKALEIAKAVEDSEVDAIAVHGRTRKQGYSGTADWNVIKEIKNNLSIPVIGNGDIKDPKIAKEYLDNNYCDALMIGRASIGNPFIFKQLNHYFETSEIITQTSKEKVSDFYEYLDISQKLERVKIPAIKTQAQFFTKGTENSTEFRNQLTRCKTIEEIKEKMNNFLKKLE